MTLTSSVGNQNKISRTLIILVLVLAILFTSSVSVFAVAGIDDLILFTCLGLVAVAYGVTVNNAVSLRDLGALIYEDIRLAGIDLANWARDFYNNGRVVVDEFLINIFDNFNRKNKLNEVTASNVVQVNTASTTQTYGYQLIEQQTVEVTQAEYDSYVSYMSSPIYANYGGFNPKQLDNISLVLNGIYYNIQRTIKSNNAYVGTDSFTGVQVYQPQIIEETIIYNGSSVVNRSSRVIVNSSTGNIMQGYTGPINMPSRNTLNNASVTSLLVSANASLNTVNTVISVSNGILSNPDVIALGSLANIGLNQPESNNIYVPLTNNPIYNPSYQGDKASALTVGTVINYPRNLLTQTPNGFVLNNVSSDSISRPSIVTGSGTIVDSGLGNDSKWLHIPILGDLLRLLEMIYYFIVSKFQQLLDLLTGFFADILQAIKGFGEFIVDFFGDFIRVLSGYTLYQDLLSHFLPLPVARFVWASIEVTLFIGLICLVLSW